MNYILGIEGNGLIYNLDKKKEEYRTQIAVSEDVFNWLNNHDVEITAKGERVFIMNKVRYIYLGINITREELLG